MLCYQGSKEWKLFCMPNTRPTTDIVSESVHRDQAKHKVQFDSYHHFWVFVRYIDQDQTGVVTVAMRLLQVVRNSFQSVLKRSVNTKTRLPKVRILILIKTVS